MLKNILKIHGVKMLSKAEQKTITGGSCNGEPPPDCDCYGYASAGGLYQPGTGIYNQRLAYCLGYQSICVCV